MQQKCNDLQNNYSSTLVYKTKCSEYENGMKVMANENSKLNNQLQVTLEELQKCIQRVRVLEVYESQVKQYESHLKILVTQLEQQKE